MKGEIFMKKILSLFLMLTFLTSNAVLAFKDVEDSPCRYEINELYELEYISGDENGNYNPKSFLLRSEAAMIILKGLYPIETFEYVKYDTVFEDVTRLHWAWKPIQVLQAYRIINGFEDGTFRPDEEVTVAQAVNMCIKMTGYGEYVEKNTMPWYKGVIETANKYGFTEGLSLEPEAYVTREEMAKLLYNTINSPLVLVTGWTGNNGGEPIVTTVIADENSSMGFKSLLTEYYSTISPPGVASNYLGQNEEVVLDALGLKKEDYEIEGNPEKSYRVNKTYKYHGRPVTMKLFFWNKKLFSVTYEFGNRIEETNKFGMGVLNSSIALYGEPDNKKEIDELFSQFDKKGESSGFIAVWSNINEEFIKDEALTKNAEEMEKDIEFMVRVSQNEVDTAYGIESVEPPGNLVGLVEIGMRFVDKKENK